MSWNPFRRDTTQVREVGRPEEPGADQPKPPVDWGYYVAFTLALVGIVAVAAATMYVSYEAQHAYTESIKGDAADLDTANHLAAAAWDIAAAVFAILGLATAMRGDSALRSRLGNLGCVAASLLMNGAQISLPQEADTLTWAGHLLVWVGPPLLYAATSDTIVLEVQRRAMERRGLPLEHASIWSVLGILLKGVLGVVLWFGRLIFSPWRTFTLFRSWYLAEVAYAPGRTLESDKARKALEEAAAAKGFAEEVELRSAAAIAEAEADYTRRANEAEERAQREIAQVRAQEESRADEAIRKERERATNGISAERKRANDVIAEQTSRVEELEAAHALALQTLQNQHALEFQRLQKEHAKQVKELEDAVSGQQQQLARVRGDLDQAQTAAAQGAEHARELETTRQQLEREEQGRLRAEQDAKSLRSEVGEMFARLSGNAQVQVLYSRLGHAGDSRYGNPEFFAEIAEEFQDRHGVSLTTAKIVHYIRSYVSESGPVAAGVTGGSDDSMGGAL